jgi:inosose dehydratase
VLSAISDAGYEGTELGPPGYLGDRDNLRNRLEEHGLALVGGYIPIRFSEPQHWSEDLEAMSTTLDLFEAAEGADTKAVLADGGSPERAQFPGRPLRISRSASIPRVGDGVRGCRTRCRSRSEPWLRADVPPPHRHVRRGAGEIERVLELTDVGLLLDTAISLSVAAIRPEALRDQVSGSTTCTSGRAERRARERDRRRRRHAGSLARGVFCELGTGDVDLEGFFAELARSGYSGWLVVEQDMPVVAPRRRRSRGFAGAEPRLAQRARVDLGQVPRPGQVERPQRQDDVTVRTDEQNFLFLCHGPPARR